MFGIKRTRELEEGLETLESELKYQKSLVEKSEKRSGELQEEVRRLHGIEEKIREQTEADIYFMCAKTMRELESGKKKEDIKEHLCRIEQLNVLRSQQSIYASQGQFGSPLSGIFGRLLCGRLL